MPSVEMFDLAPASNSLVLAKTWLKKSLGADSSEKHAVNTPKQKHTHQSHRAWRLRTRCTHDAPLYSRVLSNTALLPWRLANGFQLGWPMDSQVI